MPRSPSMIAAASTAAALVWAVHLAVDPDPFGGAPAAVLALTLAAGAVVVGAALLLSRARWSRPALAAMAASGLALGAVTPLDGGVIAGITLSAAALAGAAGPWLAGWVRRLPAAEAPPRMAAAAVTAAGLVPAAAAVIQHHGLAAADWVLCGVAGAAAFALGRGWTAGLWLARIGLPAAGAAAAIAAALPGGLLLAAAALLAAAPAWRREVRLAVTPILPSAGNATIPPELVDPGLLAAAGYDDRGRRKERGA